MRVVYLVEECSAQLSLEEVLAPTWIATSEWALEAPTVASNEEGQEA